MKIKLSNASRMVRVVVLWLLTGLGGVVGAAEVPRFNQPVALHAVEQPVAAFVESLFQQIGVPVKVDSDIPGTVNGAFSGTAASVFEKISRAFNTHLYYDTTVVYVYRSDEIESRILPLSQAAAHRVAKSAGEMGLPNTHNRVSPISGGGLMVNGGSRFVAQIEALSKASDAQAKTVKPKKSPVVFRLFRLKYAWADDVQLDVGGRSMNIPGVATMLRTLIADDGTLPIAVGASMHRNSQTLNKLKGSGLQAHGNSLSGDAGHQQITLVAPGAHDFSIVAQPQLNAIAIRDTADRMPLYEELIESLDVEPTMVEIEATIIDINVDRQRELGINWRAQGSHGDILVGNGSASDSLLRPGQVITPQGRGGVMSLVLGDSTQFFSRVKALEEEGAARVVSKPHVITLSNVEAVLGATTEFFVRVEGNQEVDLFNVPVGTMLRVTPHVFGEGASAGIKLLVNIEDGSAVAGSQVDNIPVVERSTISTQAMIRQGSSLLLGGLVRESEKDSEYKVPVLGTIPVVGNLFKSQRTSKTKTERLFMITPRIANIYDKPHQPGPVLQGDPVDIITKAKRITAAESLAVQMRSSEVRSQLDDEVVPGGSRLLDDDLAIAMLRVPQSPAANTVVADGGWGQWYEVNGEDEVALYGDSRQLADIGAGEQAGSTEIITTNAKSMFADTRSTSYFERMLTTPVLSEPAVESGEVTFTESAVSSASTSLAASAMAVQQSDSTEVFLVTDGDANRAAAENDTAAQIKSLAAAITADLKARRLTSPESDNALAKIRRMQQLDPSHDYARNGERYISRIYASIGRRAYEKGHYKTADKWLNRALQLDHSADGVQELRVVLTEAAKGRG